jgi:L-ascorbate metabolism protein UlaG (beta-lactamase superfamily)
MKITKLGHCCLLIETKGKRILTDPGAWSDAQNQVRDIDLILITHEHQDHLHIDSLIQVIANNPTANIITNTAVGKILSEKGIAFEILEEGNTTTFESIALEAFGARHEEIYGELGQVQNTGYFIDETLFYPGDALTNPQKPVDILALPIVAPWLTFKQAMEYAIEVKPKVCFPVHDGMLQLDKPGPIYRMPPQILEPHGIAFIPLLQGETKAF